jgi:membrane protein
MIRRALRAISSARADDLFLYSAALAFYGLISVAPLVVVALWIASLVVGPTEIHHAAATFASVTPRALGADRALERVADFGAGLGLLAVVAALWPATAYGSALVQVLDRLAGERQATGLRGRGAALLLIAFSPVLVLGCLVASYAGADVLGDASADIALGITAAFVLGFTATALNVAAIYRVFPRTPPAWRSTIRSALLVAAVISLLSVAYVAYLRFGANFERRYASAALAAVVLLGLWLFAASMALLVCYRAALGPVTAVRAR